MSDTVILLAAQGYAAAIDHDHPDLAAESPIGIPPGRRAMDLTRWIREVPDYPKPGVLFRDITPLLAHPPAFNYVVDMLIEELKEYDADAIGVIDARGFLFGAPVAYALGLPLIPFRKAAKLSTGNRGCRLRSRIRYRPHRVESPDNFAGRPHRYRGRCFSPRAARRQPRSSSRIGVGARVQTMAFVIELEALQGRAALPGVEVRSLLKL